MLANWEHSGAFNADDFAGNTEPSLAIFIENGFTLEPLLRGNFALFAVIHNPTGHNVLPNGNSIQIAYQHNAQGRPIAYHQFTMQYYGSTTSGSGFGEGRFIKFRVLGVGNFEAVTTEERRYYISGFQLMFTGNTNPLAFQVGLIYKVTGFQVGLAAPGSPTLAARQYDLDFVRLDAYQTFYLTAPERNYPRRNMISSVYFSVPARFIHQYGELHAITALWYEFQTSPMLATPRRSLFDFVYANVGRTRERQSGDYSVVWDRHWVSALTAKPDTFSHGWNNRPVLQPVLSSGQIDFMSYVFMTGEDHIVPRGEVINWINSYTANFPHTASRRSVQVGGRNLSNDLFTNTVDVGRTRGRQVQNIRASELLNLNLRRSSGQAYANVRAIERITYAQIQGLSVARVAQDFFMWESDVEAFRAHVRANSLANNYTFVFRFANTNYYQFTALNSGVSFSAVFGNLFAHSFSYVVQCTVFLDFTIIELEFDNGGVFTTIPVVMNPIDVVPDLVPPPGWNPDEGSCRWFEVLLFWVVAFFSLSFIISGLIALVFKVRKGGWKTFGFWVGVTMLVLFIIALVLLAHFNVGPICWCLLRGGG
jgi:hypothetical protein